MTERQRDKRDRTCFVPGCKSGYRSCKEARSIFRAPLEPERLEAWSRNIRRSDRVLDQGCVVCDRHFDPRFIERTYRTKINGEIVEIPRDRPKLTKDAIPTIFPEAPKYHTMSLPTKRKERNLSNQALPEPKRREEEVTVETVENRCSDATTTSSEDGNCDACSSLNEHVETTGRLLFSKLEIPRGWSEITLVDAENSFLYAECELDAAEPYSSVVMSKSVRIEVEQSDGDAVTAEVHLRGKKWRQERISTRKDAEALIESVSKLALCSGVGLQPLAGNCPAYNGKFFSKDCVVLANSKILGACEHCKYQRKLIQNQMSRRRKGYEVVMTRTSDERWLVQVNLASAKCEQATEQGAADSVEVFVERGTE